MTIDEQTPQEETTQEEPIKTSWRYAQVDSEGKCVSVSFLSGEVIADNMIELTDEDDVSPLDTLVEGAWLKYIPPTPEPVVDEMAELKQANADLNLQIIDLWEALLSAGVL